MIVDRRKLLMVAAEKLRAKSSEFSRLRMPAIVSEGAYL